MVPLIFTLILLSPTPALAEACQKAALLEQFTDIESRAGTANNEEELFNFYAILARCKVKSEDLAITERKRKVEDRNATADTRAKLAAILQNPKKNDWKKIDELQKFGQLYGMKKSEFDQAKAKWKDLYFSAEKKRSEQTAQRCESKNQLSRFPPAHSQGNLGWCYAYVGADLLAFETGRPVAPLSIGLGYFQKNNYGDFLAGDQLTKEKLLNSTGGHIADAIAIAQKEGVCPARQDVAAGDLFDRVLTLLDRTKIPSFKENEEKFCDTYATATLTLFPGLSTQDFERILHQAGVQDILQEMKKASCQKKTKLPKNLKVEITFYEDESPASVEAIQAALLRNSVAGVSVNLNLLLKEKPASPSNHAMIVVGQEWNPQVQQCEFTIRNSWGNSCEKFNPQMAKCDPATGVLKVRADHLREITYGTTTLSR